MVYYFLLKSYTCFGYLREIIQLCFKSLSSYFIVYSPFMPFKCFYKGFKYIFRSYFIDQSFSCIFNRRVMQEDKELYFKGVIFQNFNKF